MALVLIGTSAIIATLKWPIDTEARKDSIADAADSETRNYVVKNSTYMTGARLLRNSSELLIAKCMHSHGLNYVPTLRRGPIVTGAPYRDGYGLYAYYSGQFDAEKRSSRALMRMEADRRYRVVLLGDLQSQRTLRLSDGSSVTYTIDGCISYAAKRLYGSRGQEAQVVGEGNIYYSRYVREVTNDATMKAATSAWSRCMASSGYRYASPSRVVPALSDEYSRAVQDRRRAHGLERRVAGADARCRADSRYTKIEAGAERRLVLPVIRSHPEVPGVARAYWQAVKRARQLA